MGRAQSLALASLGAWLGATLLMWFVAGGSFSTVERVLQTSDPHFAEYTRALGQGQSRVVLRYLASEINRTCFRAYGWGQVALGLLLLVSLLWQRPRDTFALVVAGAMLALVVVLTLIITPQIVALGRSLDFAARDPMPPGMARFRALHAAFTGLDGAKMLAGLTLLIRWEARR